MKINGLFDFQLDKELIKNCILFSIGYMFGKVKFIENVLSLIENRICLINFSYYAILVEFEFN